MNFNHLSAAAAAAASGNPNNLNMSSFTTAVTNILANSNIDISQLAGLTQLSQNAALNAAVQQQQQHHNTSRQNLQQAHHHRSSNLSLNSTSHLQNSMSNLQNVDQQAAGISLAGLPASLSNLTSSALAELTAGSHQIQSLASHGGGRSSIQSAHHRGSSSNYHHHNQSQSQSQHHLLNHGNQPLTAAHQSTSASKNLSSAHHHQSHQNTVIHHRHQSSHSNSSTTALNHHNSNNNLIHSNSNILGNNINSSNNISSTITNNNTNNSSQNIIATNSNNPITPPKSSICYRVGDCIYFESSPSLPSQLGRIDEVCKTTGDNVEVKVVIFFRRTDIPSSLMALADKYQYDETQEEEIKQMSEKDKDLLKQRELFYSRQIETIPASSIRGKCTVQLLNESESLASYLSKDDNYFYTLVYDPQQKTITADRGEIRVGQRYQAEVQPNPIYTRQEAGDPADPRDLSEMETLVYRPDHNLTDDDINKFLTIAKSVGTFARALDCSSSIKQPSLHLTAASASRDVTLLYAMQLLHKNDYDLGKAVCALVPSTGPVLCRDEIEEWTAGEATLFEEAIEKYGREFNDIRQDFLPWKSVKNIVEYYYMWKTTDRSINQRRMKALEAENKVNILYITDPEAELKKSPTNNILASNTSTTTSVTSNNNSTNPSAASATGAQNNPEPTRTARSAKRPQESDETSLNSSMENSNATLKRRQVTEPKLSSHVACHTMPGENLRFISSKRHKAVRRGLINRKQLRHLARRPWERRAKPRT